MKTYGYRYQINRPGAGRWYKAFHRALRLVSYVPLTDRQRLALEADILDPLREHGKLPQDSLISAEDLKPRPWRKLW